MTEQYIQPELPFEGGLPPSINEFDLKSFVGCAVMIAVGGCHPEMPTRYGVKPVVRGAAVILNGPDAGKEFIDVLFFNSRVVRTLRGVPGRAFIAHVDIDNGTTNPAVVLLDPSPDEYELARKWHADNPERTNELVRIMVATFNQSQSQAGSQPQAAQHQAQPARSAPPTGPNYARSIVSNNPPPSAPPRSAPPTQNATVASMQGERFEPLPVTSDDLPF